jgi:hypothetical protein
MRRLSVSCHVAPIALFALFALVLSGCASAAEPEPEHEQVASVSQASTAYGVRKIPSCLKGPPVRGGWPTPIDLWVEIYGAFDYGGKNVSANVDASFPDGSPMQRLGYLGSNWRSASQVNLHFAGQTTGACPGSYRVTVSDGARVLGTF